MVPEATDILAVCRAAMPDRAGLDIRSINPVPANIFTFKLSMGITGYVPLPPRAVLALSLQGGKIFLYRVETTRGVERHGGEAWTAEAIRDAWGEITA